jgi:hypothetical protein
LNFVKAKLFYYNFTLFDVAQLEKGSGKDSNLILDVLNQASTLSGDNHLLLEKVV